MPGASGVAAPVFTARAITKVYRMGEVTVEALRGVDFDLSAGEFVVLLGPSGSGKSTLLNILGGLDVPTAGRVVYKDHDLTAAGEAALTDYRRTHVGFVFQFYNLIPSLTARENVALVTEIVEHPMAPEEALAMVGLDHRLDHFPAQLSGGEQQRVAIARAIAKRPDVLLCDEPTGALDITTGVLVLDALARVNRELGTATVVITHNAAIAGMADRVVRLADGRIAGIERHAATAGGDGAALVSLVTRLPILDRKLLRDLWEMKGQSIAIAAVLAAGVAMFVTYLSNFDSLRRTRDGYFDAARFADVFASLTRAPSSLEPRMAAIPGVEVVATRVVADVTLDVPGLPEPATGRLISVPERGHPPLNDVYLRRGHWVDPTRPDEVIANDAFMEANGFNPGDRVAAVINGRRRWLTIVGVGLSPEYVYGIRPGEIFPDKKRFGIFWMDRRALASAFNMEGGFNDVSLTLAHGASTPDVIAALDRLLAPYGGRGAIPRSLQPSAWTLENELSQLQTFGFITPLIFFGVAAFVLNVALTRALALQRPQIASLKALGYRNREIGWHYLKWGLLIAAGGALAGVAAGAWLGSGMITLYNRFFRFPNLDYHLSPGVAVAAVASSLVAAGAGAMAAVRRAVRVPPAEAMRPEAPAGYRASVFERLPGRSRMTMATRMILRNLERAPIRSAVSVVGIAFAVAVLFVGLAFLDVMDRLINQQFEESMRQDATITLVQPRSVQAEYDVEHLPGVMDVEPIRAVPVRLRHDARTRTLAITGLPAVPRLNRIVDRGGRPVALPAEGLVLSQMLGDLLGVRAGDLVQVEVLEGSRPVRDVPVAALVDDSVGLQAYMQIDALRRTLREGAVVTGAALTLDSDATDRFYRRVKTDSGDRRRRAAGGRGGELPRDDGREHEPVDLLQRPVRRRDRLRRRLQLRPGVALGAGARAGEPARARVHAGRDLADPPRRARAAHRLRAPGRRGDRVRIGPSDHGRLQQRGLSAVVCRRPGHAGVVLPHRDAGGVPVGPGRAPAARSPRPGGGPEDA